MIMHDLKQKQNAPFTDGNKKVKEVRIKREKRMTGQDKFIGSLN